MSELRFPFETPPPEGEAIELAQGVLWIRMPLPMALDHINIYALRNDQGGWDIVDAGVYSKRSIEIWQKVIAGPLGGDPIHNVLLTHYHPDHVGAIGWLQSKHKARLITSRLSYTYAKMLILDVQDSWSQGSIDFYRRAGVPSEMIEARRNSRPYNFADVCAPLEIGIHTVQQGSTLRFGSRDWDVHFGHGHAPDHVTLWEKSGNLVIIGDQAIAGITPNVSVHATEPDANPLAEFMESCARLETLANPDQLALSGHKLPFYGLDLRLGQLHREHVNALDRLRGFLSEPRVATDAFPILFRREINSKNFGLALGEALAHILFLWHAGEVEREIGPTGAWQWKMKG